jgi:hypothetical protein
VEKAGEKAGRAGNKIRLTGQAASAIVATRPEAAGSPRPKDGHGERLHENPPRRFDRSGEGAGNAGVSEDFAMTEETTMRDHRDAKAMAKAMRVALAGRGLTITHAEALEIVARQFGHDNWNILSALIERERAPTIPGAPAAPGAIAFEQAVPMLRIFDVAKAHEFYLGFLGFSVDWEHRFGEGFPLYTPISRAGLRLHLTEHAGDATPGANMCVYMSGIRALHAELIAKNYRYMRPGLEDEGTRLEVTVIDPFNNRIRFMELKPE